MATIAASIAETVAGMQRVLHRNEYSSDSDEPYMRPSNHFNKLKRKSHFAARDAGGRANGAPRRRKTVQLGGYTRDILRRNPRRYDEDGEELATDDDDEAADERAAAENPYSEIHLETLLAPLTAAEDLPTHPSLSTIYKSSTLSDMAESARESLERERKKLASSKRLMIRLRGDDTWVPAGRMRKAYDEEIFDTSRLYNMITSRAPATEALQTPAESTLGRIEGSNHGISTLSTNDVNSRASQDHEDRDVRSSVKPESTELPEHVEDGAQQPKTTMKADSNQPQDAVAKARESNGNSILPSVESNTAAQDVKNNDVSENGPDNVEEGSSSPPRRVTRAQAQADKDVASSKSESPRESGSPQLHPLFLLPPEANPDHDLGLPQAEAIETRQLLHLYVQKQEEVCRGAQRIYEGLLQADRQRKAVFKWCKAEGHIGEMSDGEDWYDKEEWGLENDLRKGQAEEEEDTITQGKKTRGRRA